MKHHFVLISVALLMAVSSGDAQVLSSEHDTEQYTQLFSDAAAGNIVAIQVAVQKDKSVLTATEWDDATLLHLAVGQNHKELAEYLIAQGADVNAQTRDHLTPLHMAAQNANITIAVLLLRNGAKINPVDLKGWTPLDRAEKWNHPLTSAFLKKNGGKEGSSL
jgi:ankyrin repeat protein